MIRIPVSLVAISLASFPFAAAQSLNVDVGANTTFGTPSSSYGAAAASSGAWNAFDANSVGAVALVGLSGVPTAVTLSISGGQGNFEFDNAGTLGDDQALMDDAGDLNLAGGGLDTATYTFQGLVDGRYSVYAYAWAPDTRSFTTDVLASGGEPCVETCGGAAWTGGHVEGVTYVVQDVAVSNGVLTLDVASNLGWGSCNGIQLVKKGSVGIATDVLGVIRKRCSFPPVGNVKAVDIECAFGLYWVLWVDSVTGDSSLRGYDKLTCLEVFSFPNALSANSTGMSSRSLNGFSEFVMTNENGYAVYQFDASLGTLACVNQTTVPHKKEAAVDLSNPICFWSVGIGGSIEKCTLDASYNLNCVALSAPLPFQAEGLAYDYVSGVLWAFARTANCPVGSGLVEFHAVDPNSGVLLGVNFTGDLGVAAPNLARGCGIDVSGGTLAIVAMHDGGAQTEMVVYDLGIPTPSGPVAYCTAGTSTNGCAAAISATFQPSVSQSTLCVISATNVEGAKAGLLFYGINNAGFSPMPWAASSSSFLCVKAPSQRTGVQFSGGVNGSCTGSLTLDWNSYAASHPATLGTPFSPGDKIYLQAWYRDPPAPKSTHLSDGLEMTFWP